MFCVEPTSAKWNWKDIAQQGPITTTDTGEFKNQIVDIRRKVFFCSIEFSFFDFSFYFSDEILSGEWFCLRYEPNETCALSKWFALLRALGILLVLNLMSLEWCNIFYRSSRIDRRTDRTTMLLVAVLLLFLITEFPQGILGLLSGIIGKWWIN